MATLTVALYVPGLGGGFIFDDYPNIVDNPMVQPAHTSISELMAAALSSPSSDLKRPLASLSFAANFLMAGLDASAMKATNIALHVVNGWLVFFICRALLRQVRVNDSRATLDMQAAIIALAWLAAPINLTAVLYVVQRMESLANIFVLIGLWGYASWRRRAVPGLGSQLIGGAWLAIPTLVGALAKETAVLLPLYALCMEGFVFRFRYTDGRLAPAIVGMYLALLILPMATGVAWLGPILLDPHTWATREFTLVTRLLSESRILVDYLAWTIVPTPSGLSFYHDDYIASSDALHPWTTLPSIALLIALGWFAWIVRHRRPLASLGIAWFFACHTLTGTVLPLELIYEHRNYFASLGVMLAVTELTLWAAAQASSKKNGQVLALLPGTVLIGWTIMQTGVTAQAWGEPLRLAQELARRGPESPRAQYELGRAYIIYSHYDASSPYTAQAYAPLERAASIPRSSILPEQALIFLNSRIGRSINDSWWMSMVSKLRSRPASVQDESSLDALARCLAEDTCRFPAARLHEAFEAALDHPNPSGRMLAIYASFAKRSLHDDELAFDLQQRAVEKSPGEPAYRILIINMAIERNQPSLARNQLRALEAMNIGGRLDRDLKRLHARVDSARSVP